MQPQVEGNLTRIFVKSGDVVKAGQLLMQIDPLKQSAAVLSQQGTQAQKKASVRLQQDPGRASKKLYEAGVVSRDAFDQATQAYENSKADYEANSALTEYAAAAAWVTFRFVRHSPVWWVMFQST